jgi:N-acetylglucosaminyldiphosphoundecaprenol N-acetyl-beta-D-mannosaminyltransferase
MSFKPIIESMQRKKIFHSVISTGSYKSFIQELFELVRYKIPSYVCFANVHMIMEAHHNEAFQKIVNNAALVAPDGKPLSVLLKLLYGIQQDRICGMDVMPDLLREAEARNKSVYFYGTTPELLDVVTSKAKKEFPNLKIAGYYSPPFRELTPEEDKEIISQIKSADPDFILVSLGCPKQEKWMASHRNDFDTCMLGLGQAFKVYAGEEKRLPVWMRNLSLEWVYRLYLEPKRLWKRYAYTNSYFLLLAVKEYLRHISQKTATVNKEKMAGQH